MKVRADSVRMPDSIAVILQSGILFDDLGTGFGLNSCGVYLKV